MKNPKISIIIPVYNTQKYIARCLDSVTSQTLSDTEILVINDGSTDDSEDIIKEYKDKIKYIYQENKGQAVARNAGIRESKGEYLCFVDSDDYIDLDMCKKLYDHALNNNADIVVCDLLKIYDDEIKEIYKNMNNFSTNMKINYVLSNAGPCGKIIKRDIIINNNLYFKEGIIYEDLAVVPTYALFANNISYLEEALYNYYQRCNSTMNQQVYNTKFEDIFISIKSLEETFINSGNKEKYKSELEFLYIEHLLRNAALRFLPFKKYDNIKKIVDIMKSKYPKWYKNKYFKKYSIAKKLYALLIYKQKFEILDILKNLKNRKK